MRLTVTRLGATGASADVVARRIVGYLEGEQPSPARQLLGARDDRPGAAGAVRYFSDSMEGSGRWLGRGAAEMGLTGDVDPTHFERILAGRHPVTGARLVEARGSAGRRHLAVGTISFIDQDGEAHYELRDVAAIAGLSIRDVKALATRGVDEARCHPGLADWLRTTVSPDGRDRLVSATELARWWELADAGVSGAAVRAAGSPAQWLTTTEAARLLGLSPQYVRRMCQRHLDQRERPESGAGAKAGLACERTTKGRGSRYRIRRADLAEFADRRKAPAVRVGFDLTLTTEKSFAVLMMLSGTSRRSTFEHALDAGNDVALAYLEDHAAFTRHKGQRVGTTGLTVASYLHGTSRALDPFPHRHNIVANTALDANGDRKTLDARAFYQQAPVAAALATAEMRWQLSTQLGITWRRSRRGVWEIAGVPDVILDEFSQRRDEIEAAVTELERVLGRKISKNEVQQVVLDTRTAKQPTTVAELLASWRERSAHHGFDISAIDGCFHHPAGPQWDEATEALVIDRLAGPTGMTEQVNWFTRGDVIRALVDLEIPADGGPGQPLVLPPAEIEALADRFLGHDQVVELLMPDDALSPAKRGTTEPNFTTMELLETQERIRYRFAVGLGAARVIVPEALLTAALAESPTLDDHQIGMVSSFCRSGAQIQAAIGPPGSGKTAAMAAAAAAWRAAGFTVIGAAVKGEAARLLGHAAGIETNTLAWFLAHDDLDRHPFDSQTVVIVDEASTIADRDLDRLMAIAEATGCVLRLVGDPAQHGAVGAGGSFAALTVTHRAHTPSLHGNRRLRDQTERAVAELVRAGSIPQALALMTQAGRVIEADSDLDAQVNVIDRWWTHRQSGNAHPMVDRINTNRRTLNALAHLVRVAAGEVEPAGFTTMDGREFGVGDEIIAKAPARHLHPPRDPSRYVRNGSLGTVVHTTTDGLLIDFEDLGRIDAPRTDIDGDRERPGLDYAYAVTSYAVQGATFDRSTSVITPDSSKAELYVDITRGRDENVIVMVNPTKDREDEPHLPRLPPPPLARAVAEGVANKPGEQAVIDLDPLALDAARARAGRSLASLHAERLRLSNESQAGPAHTTEVLTRAEALAEGALRRAVGINSPAGMDALIGARPAVPWQATRWDQAAQAVAVYEARWLRPWLSQPMPHQATDHNKVAGLVATVGHNSDEPSTATMTPPPAAVPAAGRSL